MPPSSSPTDRPFATALSLTETEDVNSWSRASGFSHINASNGTLMNGTVPHAGIIPLGQGYGRPGYELPLAKGIPLRIMAIGASTTRGDESFDNNGFRRPVKEHLVAIGNPVNFVGTQRVGNMTDNDIEAYPGARTDEMHGHAQEVVPRTKPNLFLVNVGSNDCFQHWDIPNFFKRYYSFIDYLLTASPRSTVVMGTLLPTTETERFNGSEHVAEVNKQMHRLYKIMRREGKPVVLADMMGPDGVQESDLASDGMHPTSAAYIRMGQILLRAIIQADALGFLRPAEPVYGIIQDGDLERQDEAYGKWSDEQKRIEYEAQNLEGQEIARMAQELQEWTISLELKKNEADNPPRDPVKIRRHA
ncbi:SGNH hydrolase-type esterase domain-containing protein [Xylariales sp. AK1849]|nr:SGNH hydrolase-type esterase domain-containing protein [Xylariales sp. AK1849]